VTNNPGILRLAPHPPEAEEAVIGGILTDPDLILFVAAYLKPEDFHINRLAICWKAMLNLFERKEGIDVLTVSEEIRALGKADQFEDKTRGFLVNLINRTPSSEHAEMYAQLVKRLAVRRNLLTAADGMKELAYNELIPLEKVTTDAEALLLKAVGAGVGKRLRTVGDIAGDVYQRAEDVREGSRVHIYPPPSKKLDEYNLFGEKRYGIIAGRPGMGKTWVCLWIALHFARLGHPVFFFTVEMSEEDLTQRLLCMMSGVQSQKFDNGVANAREWERFSEALGETDKLPLFIDTPPVGLPATPSWIRGRIRRGFQQLGHIVGVDLMPIIIVDYIQHERMSGGERFEKQNRHREISYISAQMVGIAQDASAHVIAAAQLSREVADRSDRRPRKEDLKESGSLEQDGHWIMLLHSDDYYDDPQAQVITLEAIIDKNRGGRKGVEKFRFDTSIGKVD